MKEQALLHLIDASDRLDAVARAVIHSQGATSSDVKRMYGLIGQLRDAREWARRELEREINTHMHINRCRGW